MSDRTEVIFLGVNDAGMRVYDWLCDHEDVFVHSLLTTKQQLSVIENVQPDFVVSCGYRHIIPEPVLSVPTEGCINLHPAYLPYNRGANPNVWSIVEDTPAGVTLHYMDAGVDTGDIVARQTVDSDFSDTGKQLYKKLEDAQVSLFKQTWDDVADGTVSASTQDQSDGTYHCTSEFETLCELDPTEEVQIKPFLDRLRALTFPPYDNARIEVDEETYYVDIKIRKQ